MPPPAKRAALRVEPLEDRSLLSGGLLGGSGASLLRVDPVLLWNTVATTVHVIDITPGDLPGSAARSQPGPTRTSRALAMVQGAVYDAVNAIDRTHAPYLLTQTFGRYASRPAAVAVAAHDTLVSLYPQQQPSLDLALTLYLATIRNGTAEREGVRAGKAAAAAMIAARTNDGATAPAAYTPGTQPGDHRADPINPGQGFLHPGWGNVKPFTLDAGGGTGEFPSAPPPALTSAEYAAAFNEVKVLGADDAETADRDNNGLPDRTHEQTLIGYYWAYDGPRGIGTPPRLYNQIAQTIAVQQRNSLSENARLFALANFAMADATIQCWDAKYDYDFWRPVVAIREADPGTGPSGLGDGNPLTQGEADWTPLGAPSTNAPAGTPSFTPNFPAYASGHAGFGGALFKTLERFYGRDDVTFTFVSDELNGRSRDPDGTVRPYHPRTFTSFSQAAEENGRSRIYLGIHWSFDSTVGTADGGKVADFVYDNFLEKNRHGRGHGAVALPTGGETGDSGGGGGFAAAFAPVSLAPATPPAAPAAEPAPVVVPPPATVSGEALAFLTGQRVDARASRVPAPAASFAAPEPIDPLALDKWSAKV